MTQMRHYFPNRKLLASASSDSQSHSSHFAEGQPSGNLSATSIMWDVTQRPDIMSCYPKKIPDNTALTPAVLSTVIVTVPPAATLTGKDTQAPWLKSLDKTAVDRSR